MSKNEIKVWDYTEEYDADRENIIKIVDKVFSSGQLILGENVKCFEEEFAQWCQSKYGIGVANGTDAISAHRVTWPPAGRRRPASLEPAIRAGEHRTARMQDRRARAISRAI